MAYKLNFSLRGFLPLRFSSRVNLSKINPVMYPGCKRRVGEAFIKQRKRKQSQNQTRPDVFMPHHFPGLERCLFEEKIELVLAHYASLPQPTRYPVQNNQTQLLLHLNPGDKRNFDAIRSRRGGEEEEVGGKKIPTYTRSISFLVRNKRMPSIAIKRAESKGCH